MAVFGLFLLAVAVLTFDRMSIASIPTITAKIVSQKTLTQAAVTPVWPDYGSGAIGAVGYDGVLAQYGDKSARPMASITKIVTALVVLDKKPLNGKADGPEIKLTQVDQDIYNKALAAGAAVKPVAVGGSMSERQMLEAMLLPSAANYSETLAVWAYGSVDNYLTAAKVWLKKQNLTTIELVDTSGLLSGNVSSSADLLKLGKLALNNSALASIVNLKQVNITDLGTINNSNYLLGALGINGIKTGTTSEAGACMLFSSEIKVGGEKVTIVGVLLGADGRDQQNSDVKNLLKSVQTGFRSVKVLKQGQALANYQTAWGQSARLVSARDVNVVSWSDKPVTLKIKAGKFTVAKGGQQEGVVEITTSGKTTQQPLVLDSAITKPNLLWRLTHLINL